MRLYSFGLVVEHHQLSIHNLQASVIKWPSSNHSQPASQSTSQLAKQQPDSPGSNFKLDLRNCVN